MAETRDPTDNQIPTYIMEMENPSSKLAPPKYRGHKALPSTITAMELVGLPYQYHYTDEELWKDWGNLCRTRVFKNGAQFKPGMKLCQHFCDNFWMIENNKGLSFAKSWHDEQLMEEVLEWGRKGMSRLWLSWIRRAVYLRAGLANSSFYRPHFSKQIIGMTGKQKGVLFDPCAGWGGRMLGTVASGWEYIGCDPNTHTYTNLRRMSDFLGIQDWVTLYNSPAETFGFGLQQEVDVVLTSPPYFNLENYSNDITQSYNKFSMYDEWASDWLQPLLHKSLSILSPQGLSAWNVMNFKKYPLVEDVIRFHKERGWELRTTVGFESPLANMRKLKNKDVTYIFENAMRKQNLTG